VSQVRILALSGSQRTASWSSALLAAAHTLAPAGVDLRVEHRHKAWPLFNPDLENAPPPAVQAVRDAITAADAVLIASPEYAHGVSGTIKNTLDWLVSHPGFAGKPVAVFNPSHRAHHADAALKETLRTMAADLIADACVRIPVIGADVHQDAIAAAPVFRDAIEAALHAIAAHVHAQGKTALS
jgi:chromate reductase